MGQAKCPKLERLVEKGKIMVKSAHAGR